MVALRRIIFTSFVACVGILSVPAQEPIVPRIEGLETNSEYMDLLHKDHRITQREDSISLVVESLRAAYRANPEASSSSREQIIGLEDMLFELRACKAAVVDKLNIIEQQWVINNMSQEQPSVDEPQQSTQIVGNADVKYIFESANVRDNLSDIDYQNLLEAEKMEEDVELLSRKYIVNYDNMLSLSRSYDSISEMDDALGIKNKFDSLAMVNGDILSQLGDKWGYIYDNKSFAYSLLMEVLGFNDALQQEAELMRQAQAEISTKMEEGSGAEALLKYQVQKSSMVQFERLVAEKLELKRPFETFDILSKKLSSVEVKLLPELTLRERSFIDYEPIEFVSKTIYTSSNPIPQTVIYDRGVIFRIYVGSFQAKQKASLFRNTIPLSYMQNEKKRYCYYIGGFETFEQAEQAKADLKKHGFRSPQIVVWSDGRERNLTTDPLPLASSYRVEIEATALPEGTQERVQAVAPNSTMSKVGNDKFVIMSLQRESQVDSLKSELSRLDPAMKVTVEKSEPKIEF